MVVSAAGGVRFGQECSLFSLHILGDSVLGGSRGLSKWVNNGDN